jgi:hypothetical protein
MAEFGKHKLSDPVAQAGKRKRGKPRPPHEVSAEEARGAEESLRAHTAQASNRDRMVDIGRGNQQAGRQRS